MDEALEARAAKKDRRAGESTIDLEAGAVDQGSAPAPESEKKHSHPHLLSDPLDEEAQCMSQDAVNKRPEEHVVEEEGMGEAEEECDYLAYAQSRAFFFWGDVLGLRLVDEKKLPEALVRAARRIDY
jgi:choline kinase